MHFLLPNSPAHNVLFLQYDDIFWGDILAIAVKTLSHGKTIFLRLYFLYFLYESIATVGEIRVYWRADFQSGSRVLKKVF